MIRIHHCTFLAQGNSAWENGSTISVNRVKEIIARKLKGLENIPGSVRLKKLTLDLGDFDTLEFNSEFIDRLEQSCQNLERKLRELQRSKLAERSAEEKVQLDELIAFLYSLEYTQQVQNLISFLESMGVPPKREEWGNFAEKYARMFGDQIDKKLGDSLKAMLPSTESTKTANETASTSTTRKKSSTINQDHIDFLVESFDRIPMNTRWFQALDNLFSREFGSKMSLELYQRIRKVYDSFEFEMDSNKRSIRIDNLTETDPKEQLLEFLATLDKSTTLESAETDALKRLLQKINWTQSDSFFSEIIERFKDEYGRNISNELERQLIRFQQVQNPISWTEVSRSKRQRLLNKLRLLKELTSSKAASKKASKNASFTDEEYAFLCNQLKQLNIDASWYSRLLSNYQRAFKRSMPDNLQRLFLNFSEKLFDSESAITNLLETHQPTYSDVSELIRSINPQSKLLSFLSILKDDQWKSKDAFDRAYREFFGHEMHAEDESLLRRAFTSMEEVQLQVAFSENFELLQELLGKWQRKGNYANSIHPNDSLEWEQLKLSILTDTPLDIGWFSRIDEYFLEVNQRNLPKKIMRELMQLLSKIWEDATARKLVVPFDMSKENLLISVLHEKVKSLSNVPDAAALLHILPSLESAQKTVTFNELMAGFFAFYGREISLVLKETIWDEYVRISRDTANSAAKALKLKAKKALERYLSESGDATVSTEELRALFKQFLMIHSELFQNDEEVFSSFEHYFELETGSSLPKSGKWALESLWKELRTEFKSYQRESLTSYDSSIDPRILTIITTNDRSDLRGKQLTNKHNQDEADSPRLPIKRESSGVLHPDFIRPAIDFILAFLDRSSLPKNWIKLLQDEFLKEFKTPFPIIWQNLLERYAEQGIQEHLVASESLFFKLQEFLRANVDIPGADKLFVFLSTLENVDSIALESLEMLFELFELRENEALPLGLKMMLHKWFKDLDENAQKESFQVFPSIRQELEEMYESQAISQDLLASDSSDFESLRSIWIDLLSQESAFPESGKLLQFVSNLNERELRILRSLDALFADPIAIGFEKQENEVLSKEFKSKLIEVIDQGSHSHEKSDLAFPSIRSLSDRQSAAKTGFGGDSLSDDLKSKLIDFLTNDLEFSESKKLLAFVSKLNREELKAIGSLDSLFAEFEKLENQMLSKEFKSRLIKVIEQGSYSHEKSDLAFPSIRQSAVKTGFHGDSISGDLKSTLIDFLTDDLEFSESKKLLAFLSKFNQEELKAIGSLDALFAEFENQTNKMLSKEFKSRLIKVIEQGSYSHEKSGLAFPSIRQIQSNRGLTSHVNQEKTDIGRLQAIVEDYFDRAEKEEKNISRFLHFMIDSVPLDVHWFPTVVENYKRQFKRTMPTALFTRLLNFTKAFSETLSSEVDHLSFPIAASDPNSGKQLKAFNELFDQMAQEVDSVEIFERVKKFFLEFSRRKGVLSIVEFTERYEQRFNEKIPSEMLDRMVGLFMKTAQLRWDLLPISQRQELIDSTKKVLSERSERSKSTEDFNQQLAFVIQVLERTPIDASWFARIRNAYEAKFGSAIPDELSKHLLDFSEKITPELFQQDQEANGAIQIANTKVVNADFEITFTDPKNAVADVQKSTFVKPKRNIDFYLESKVFLSSKWEQLRNGWTDFDQVKKEYFDYFNEEIPSEISQMLESKLIDLKGETNTLSTELNQFLRKKASEEQISLLTELLATIPKLTKSNWFEALLNAHKNQFGSSLPLAIQQLLLLFASQKKEGKEGDEEAKKIPLRNWKIELPTEWKTFVEKVQKRLNRTAQVEQFEQLNFITDWFQKWRPTPKEIALLELAFQRRFHQQIPRDWKTKMDEVSGDFMRSLANEMGTNTVSVGSKTAAKKYNFGTSHYTAKTDFERHSENFRAELFSHIVTNASSTDQEILIHVLQQIPVISKNSWFQQLTEIYKLEKKASMPPSMQHVLLDFLQMRKEKNEPIDGRSNLENDIITSSPIESGSAEVNLLEFLSNQMIQTAGKVDLKAFFSKLLEMNISEIQTWRFSFKSWFGIALPHSFESAFRRLHSSRNDFTSRLIIYLKENRMKDVERVVQSLGRLQQNNWLEKLSEQYISTFNRVLTADEQKSLLSFAANDEFAIETEKNNEFVPSDFKEILNDLIEFTHSKPTLLNGLNERYHLIKDQLMAISEKRTASRSGEIKQLQEKFRLYFGQHLSSKEAESMIETVDQLEKSGANRTSRVRLRPTKPSQRKMISNKVKLIRLREELKAIKDGKKLEEPIIVMNAGLVFGWVFWKSIFSGFSWLEEGKFIRNKERDTAICAANWFHFLVNDVESVNPLVLFICGLEEKEFEWMTEEELEREMNEHRRRQPRSESLPESIYGYYEMMLAMWPIFELEQLSDFIALFVDREALILESPFGIKLKLVKEPIDALVETKPLPWPMSMINFSWTSRIIEVEW